VGYGLRDGDLHRDCEPGEVIVREGDTSREMYVIEHGRVQIEKRAGDDRVVLASLEKGDFFGEIALLGGGPRDATAVAVVPTRLLVIQAGGLLLRFRRDPTFAFEMVHKLSRRVSALNEKVVGLLEDRPEASDGVAQLLSFGPDRRLKDPT
jgi:CRP/FNR family cyclic AMP-dependent transcriptional regulator